MDPDAAVETEDEEGDDDENAEEGDEEWARKEGALALRHTLPKEGSSRPRKATAAVKRTPTDAVSP